MKDKDIHFRVSSDLYYTIIGFARSLGISVSALLIESVLASEVVHILVLCQDSERRVVDLTSRQT